MTAEPGFLALVAVVSLVAGVVASLSGFGLGSLLTPLLAGPLGTRLAVAVACVPHLVAAGVRLGLLRQHLDYKLFLSFGLMSAAGGLTGALLQAQINNAVLTAIFGAILIVTGAMGLSGFSDRLRFQGWGAWIAGGLSGFLGGLVGNQGGIRSAALLGFDVAPQAFVATATAAGIVVDLARLPVYAATQGADMLRAWPVMAVAVGGAVAGTIVGTRLLKGTPAPIYRRVIGALVIALGAWLLIQGAQ